MQLTSICDTYMIQGFKILIVDTAITWMHLANAAAFKIYNILRLIIKQYGGFEVNS